MSEHIISLRQWFLETRSRLIVVSPCRVIDNLHLTGGYSAAARLKDGHAGVLSRNDWEKYDG